MGSWVRFVKDSWQELKLVTWLTRTQMVASTWMVIVLVVIFSIYVGIVDFAVTFLFGKVI